MEWISVKEELPKDDQTVLMIEEGQDGIPVIGWYEGAAYIPGFYPAHSFQTVRMHVTHWMPIPDKPTTNI